MDSYQISNLKVAGYADTLSPEMLPTRVPPILLTAAGDYLCPPFAFIDDQVVGGTLVDAAEFNQLAIDGKANSFSGGFALPAQVNHELWIDESGDPHYELRSEVAKKLADAARQYAEDAKAILASNGDPEKARFAAGRAIAAKADFLDGYVASAAAYRRMGKPDNAEVMKEVALQYASNDDFETALAGLSPLKDRSRSMKNVAKQKPRYDALEFVAA